MSEPNGTLTMEDTRSAIGAAEVVVIKVGTALLTGGGSTLDEAYIHDLGAGVARAWSAGRKVLLISSGAVGAGLSALDLDRRPSDVSQLQAAAAVGQPLLMDVWRDAFSVRGLSIGQLLVSRSDFDARDRFLNIRNCVHCLLDRSIVPIINENDSVATDEISLGDNDVLAAKFAGAIQAGALIILTTSDGVLDTDSKVIAHARDASELAPFVRTDSTNLGKGGMATKIQAAEIASMSGIPCVITNGRPPEALGAAIEGRGGGTSISPKLSTHAGKRLWIAFGATPAGTLDVDDGAATALTRRGASLLAKGVQAVTGRFNVGDVLVIRDDHGKEIARGLSNFTSNEVRALLGHDSRDFEAILGRSTHEEVVHRDNLALTR